MADIYLSTDAHKLLYGKKVFLIGDSNVRALYKDIVCLLVRDRLLSERQLRERAERSFLGDVLLRGSALTKGRDYREDRRFQTLNIHVEFHFVTRCLNEDIEDMMKDIRRKRISAPDIIVMNSTLWDINRWGPRGVEAFKDNMNRLMRLFKSSLPPSTLVIWVTAPPLSVEIRGGFIIKQIEYTKFTMRFHVMEANMFAQQLVSQYGYNVLDVHYHWRWHVQWRNVDGIHWKSEPMRHLTNLLLTHIALAYGVSLPGRRQDSLLLEKHKALVNPGTDFTEDASVVLPKVPQALLRTHQPQKQQLPQQHQHRRVLPPRQARTESRDTRQAHSAAQDDFPKHLRSQTKEPPGVAAPAVSAGSSTARGPTQPLPPPRPPGQTQAGGVVQLPQPLPSDSVSMSFCEDYIPNGPFIHGSQPPQPIPSLCARSRGVARNQRNRKHGGWRYTPY